eukprot:9470233-Pyramimonas_sp.AAC.1
MARNIHAIHSKAGAIVHQPLHPHKHLSDAIWAPRRCLRLVIRLMPQKPGILSALPEIWDACLTPSTYTPMGMGSLRPLPRASATIG